MQILRRESTVECYKRPRGTSQRGGEGNGVEGTDSSSVFQENHPLRAAGEGAYPPLSLPTGRPRTWWAVGRAKRNLFVSWLTVWRRGERFTRASRPPRRAPGRASSPPPPPTHRRVQQSQQVLLIRVQERDRRPAGPPNQVGAQSQAEQSQQPHPQGGQQAWVLRGEQAA